MKIRITFERPYFEEETILALTSHDLDDFYVEANEVDRLNLFLCWKHLCTGFKGRSFSWHIICCSRSSSCSKE